jgi:pyrroloquinoline quinone biosynthesis protein B
MPIAGEQGSAGLLAASPAGRKLYVHLNNTNPVLDECGVEHDQLRSLGIEVAQDGMEFVL